MRPHVDRELHAVRRHEPAPCVHLHAVPTETEPLAEHLQARAASPHEQHDKGGDEEGRAHQAWPADACESKDDDRHATDATLGSCHAAGALANLCVRTRCAPFQPARSSRQSQKHDAASEYQDVGPPWIRKPRPSPEGQRGSQAHRCQ